MPRLGFGVGTAWFQGARGEEALACAVRGALEAGFTMVDDAEMYGNEVATGKGVAAYLDADSQRQRSDLFLVNKAHGSVVTGGAAGVREACVASLARTGPSAGGYFDLYLLHAPFAKDGTPYTESLPALWRAMEGLVDEGLAVSIGVSNFRTQDLDAMLGGGCRVVPRVNQVERHPALRQPGLAASCAARGVGLVAYGPLVSLKDTEPSAVRGAAEAIAENRRALAATAATAAASARSAGVTTGAEGGSASSPSHSTATTTPAPTTGSTATVAGTVTSAQVLLAWALGASEAVVTTTSQPGRLEESLAVLDERCFGALSAGEVALLEAAGDAEARKRRFWASLPVEWD
jgi:diketogulonate reductase-like aldo/keto reductase